LRAVERELVARCDEPLRFADDFRPRDEEDDERRLRDDVPRDERLRVDFLVAAMRI
jgi:hypothetical protein